MILQKGKIISDRDSQINRIASAAYDVYYKGFIFVSGKKCGGDSIDYIIKNCLDDEEPRILEIFGNFFIHIVDNIKKRQYTFIDNSGIFKAYKYKNCISTSFLELVDYFEEISIKNLDYNSISEFFHFGFSYLGNTLIREIRRIDANEVFIFQNGENLLKEKNLGSIKSSPKISIKDFFSDLIYSCHGKNISIDLTGGFDSRLILSFFQRAKAKFELATSGLSNNSDIKIASKVASEIKKDFFPTIHSTKNLNSKELIRIFELTDSQIDVVTYHRNEQYNNERLSRNIEVQISGVGGELYKDFWWLQDFPFYKKKKPNFEKLYNYRIESTVFTHSIFGSKLKKHSLALKGDTILNLKSYLLDTNTQTYDNIYYNYKMKTNAGVYISIANSFFFSYAPLLEFELVKIGFGLKRKVRFFNFFHRKLISENCPQISIIKTTEGISSSSSFKHIVLDIILYIFDKSKRITKQVLRKVFNKTFFQETPTDNYIYTFWKSNAFFRFYINKLKKIDILDESVDPEKIPNNIVGKILTLGLLIERLEK